MPTTTILFGLALAAYGFVSWSTSESKSPTALIPAYFGAAFVIGGLVAQKDSLRKHAMHFAAAIGVIGFLGGAVMGFPKIPAWFAGDLDAVGVNKVKSQTILALTCLVYVLLCVKSFIDARTARKGGAEQSPSPQVPK
jgi:hypothetical protein